MTTHARLLAMLRSVQGQQRKPVKMKKKKKINLSWGERELAYKTRLFADITRVLTRSN